MSKKKILLVDDEQPLCNTMKLNLEETGKFEVQTENKGSNALTAALAFNPDLIILDFMMPDLDGSDVAYQMQNDDKARNIPIIFLTAIATKQDVEQHGNMIGGHHVMAKPVETEHLVERIEDILQQGKKPDPFSKFS